MIREYPHGSNMAANLLRTNENNIHTELALKIMMILQEDGVDPWNKKTTQITRLVLEMCMQKMCMFGYLLWTNQFPFLLPMLLYCPS